MIEEDGLYFILTWGIHKGKDFRKVSTYDLILEIHKAIGYVLDKSKMKGQLPHVKTTK